MTFQYLFTDRMSSATSQAKDSPLEVRDASKSEQAATSHSCSNTTDANSTVPIHTENNPQKRTRKTSRVTFTDSSGSPLQDPDDKDHLHRPPTPFAHEEPNAPLGPSATASGVSVSSDGAETRKDRL